MEFKAEIKKTFTGPDKLRAVCSVILDDCFLVKNVRVVEGEKGLFVSLPSRRNVKGEWVEHCPHDEGTAGEALRCRTGSV